MTYREFIENKLNKLNIEELLKVYNLVYQTNYTLTDHVYVGMDNYCLRLNNQVVKSGNNFKELVNYEEFIDKIISEGELGIF